MGAVLRRLARVRSRMQWDQRCVQKMLCIVPLLWFAAQISAQDQRPAPADSDPKYTLHVYEDLVQVASLVLHDSYTSYRGLASKDFTIQLDGGPPFHPRHVRVEGDDPITLAVVLDDSRHTNTRLVSELDRALSQLPDDLLNARDHVSVFALDCSLVETVSDAPASRITLQADVAGALQIKGLHGPVDGTPCVRSVRLWDALGAVFQRIQDLPGRRVVVVVSEGIDHGSRNTWRTIQDYADDHSIAIFGVRPVSLAPMLLTPETMRVGRLTSAMEDPFELLCGETGGLVFEPNRFTLGPMFARILDMVRNRYILEFARPNNGLAGKHIMDVTVAGERSIIRTSGVAVPLKDKGLLNDPSTVPSDPARAPVIGNRRVLPQP